MIRVIVNAINKKRVSEQITRLCVYFNVMNQDYLYIDVNINPYLLFKAALDNNYLLGVCNNNVGFLSYYGVRKYTLNFNLTYNQSIKRGLELYLNTAPEGNGTLRKYVLNNSYVSKYILFFIPKASPPFYDDVKKLSGILAYSNVPLALMHYKKVRMYRNINAFNNIVCYYLFSM